MKYGMLEGDTLIYTIKVKEYGNGKGRLISIACVNERNLSENKKLILPCSACFAAVNINNVQHRIEKMNLVEYVLNEQGASKAKQELVVAIKHFKGDPTKY
jgi:hypothetical protein